MCVCPFSGELPPVNFVAPLQSCRSSHLHAKNTSWSCARSSQQVYSVAKLLCEPGADSSRRRRCDLYLSGGKIVIATCCHLRWQDCSHALEGRHCATKPLDHDETPTRPAGVKSVSCNLRGSNQPLTDDHTHTHTRARGLPSACQYVTPATC